MIFVIIRDNRKRIAKEEEFPKMNFEFIEKIVKIGVKEKENVELMILKLNRKWYDTFLKLI